MSDIVIVRKHKRASRPSGKEAAQLLAMVYGNDALSGTKTRAKSKALRALADECEARLPPALLRSVPLSECKKLMAWMASAAKHIEAARRAAEDQEDVENTCRPTGD